MFQGFIKQSEATAGRRIALYGTPTAGAAVTSVKISKDGGAFAAATNAGSAAAPSGAAGSTIKLQLAQAECDTLGPLVLEIVDDAGQTALVTYQVVPWDPYDSVRLGLTGLPNAAAGANGGLPLQGAAIPNVNAGANGGLGTVDASNAVKVQSGTGANQINLSGGKLAATFDGFTIGELLAVIAARLCGACANPQAAAPAFADIAGGGHARVTGSSVTSAGVRGAPTISVTGV